MLRHSAPVWPRFAAYAFVVAAVGLVAGMAAVTMADGWQHPANLWRDPYHDRNTHLSRAIDMALALRSFDPGGLLIAATSQVVWPPLHPLLLALVLALTGLEVRLALMPEVLGWAATVLLGGALAGRLAPGPSRLVAGLAATIAGGFTLASPAYRLLGADVMLETPGAALSACVLYAFSCCRAGDLRWPRLTCLALTALFFEKFNYWLLMTAALAFVLAFEDGGRTLARRVRETAWRRIGRQIAVHPLGLAGLGLVLSSLILLVTGPDTIDLLGRTFVLRPSGHLLAVGYGLVLLRIVILWRGETARPGSAVSPVVGVVLRWHALPCALWFLVPQALMTFLWFVGPTHAGATAHYDPVAALAFHWRVFAGGFHLSSWSAALCLLLAVPGLVALIRRGRGGRAVAAFAMLSAAAVVLHPQQQGRFQASSLFAVWVCAGVGAAVIAEGWCTRVRRPWAVLGTPMLVTAFVVALAGPPSPKGVAEAVAIRSPDLPSDLALADGYLPFVAGARGIGFIASFGVSDLFAWTVHARCRCAVPVEQPWLLAASSRAEVEKLTAMWLAGTVADRVILIDAPAPYPLPGDGVRREYLLGAWDALAAQTRFVPVSGSPVRVGAAVVTAWRLATDAPEAPPPPKPRRLFGLVSAAIGILIVIAAASPRR